MLFSLVFVSFTFSQTIESCDRINTGIVLSIYYTTYCRFCQAYMPEMEKMAYNASLKGVPITVQRINCEVCSCDFDNIKGYPTTILRENGIEIARKSGKMECSEVSNFLQQNLCETNGHLVGKNNISTQPAFVMPSNVVQNTQSCNIPMIQNPPMANVGNYIKSSC
ncbi:thioredoxin-1 [Vairimorpha necatrix]|uniref:Thioredoxin-1 n=1 Tax=Vairimorpha necatrix TaxID=6039 RepID=A0AAX4J974_9MICR